MFAQRVTVGVKMPEPEVPQRFRYVLDYLSRMPQQLDMLIELQKKQLELLSAVVKKKTVVVEEKAVTKRAEVTELEEELIPIIKPIVTKTSEYTGIVLAKDFIVIPVVDTPVEISYITYYDDLTDPVRHDFAEDTNIFILKAEDNDIYYAPWSPQEKTPDKLTAGMGVIYVKSSKWKHLWLQEAVTGGHARIIELRYSK